MKCGIAVHKACIASSSRCGIRHAPEIPPRPPFASNSLRSPVSPNTIMSTPTEVNFLFISVCMVVNSSEK